MRSALLPILLCPDCGARLDSPKMEEGTLREGELRCLAGHVWPVLGGVPRFTGEKYAESFGFQWNRFSRTQLDSVSGTSQSRDTFVETFLVGSWQEHERQHARLERSDLAVFDRIDALLSPGEHRRVQHALGIRVSRDPHHR